MSEIPFVNQLGDAIEVAIARPAPARRRFRLTRRRYLAVALAALAVAGGSAAVAELLHDPVEIGFGAVGCFEGTQPEGNIAVITDPTKSPVELCATAAPSDGLEARDLIACAWQGHGIVVVARGDRGSCQARGLAPVPAAYALGRRRAARLQALAVDFEREAGCLAAGRVRPPPDRRAPPQRLEGLARRRRRRRGPVRASLGRDRLVDHRVDRVGGGCGGSNHHRDGSPASRAGARAPATRLTRGAPVRHIRRALLHDRGARASRAPGPGPSGAADPLPQALAAGLLRHSRTSRPPIRRGLRGLRRSLR